MRVCHDHLDDQASAASIRNMPESSDDDESLAEESAVPCRSTRWKRATHSCTLYDHKIREECSEVKLRDGHGRHL